MEDITEEAKKIGELNTAAIRDSIFNRLNENEPSIVESWKNSMHDINPNSGYII
jgi:hypothetical protein